MDPVFVRENALDTIKQVYLNLQECYHSRQCTHKVNIVYQDGTEEEMTIRGKDLWEMVIQAGYDMLTAKFLIHLDP